MMHDNRETLEKLFQNRMINIKKGSIFNTEPGPMLSDFDFERFEGMMLGFAAGDALGNTTEGMLPEQRSNHYGEIRNFLPNRYAGGRCAGTPTDDTQLAFWTLEQLIADDGLAPQQLALRFCKERIFGIGGTVSRFISNIKKGKNWAESGPESAGNGALMRIAPIIGPHLRSGGRELWADAAISAMITHNDSASISACISFVFIFWELLRMDKTPAPEWWLRTYYDVTHDLESETKYQPRSRNVDDFSGSLREFVEREVWPAYNANASITDAGKKWYSGAYLLETVPIVLLILMKYAQDPEEAIVRAVNDTKDNDTIAAIVGAAVGALHGKGNLPKKWVSRCLGRTSYEDDGRIFELLDQAKKAWKQNSSQKRVHYESRENVYQGIPLPTIDLETGRKTDRCEVFF